MDKLILDEIMVLSDKKQAEHLQRFFKTGKGQYGECDLFLGIKVPVIRKLVKKYFQQISLPQIQKLITNKYHEVRLFAILCLVYKYEKIQKTDIEGKKEIFELYLSNVDYINNWDLVDLSTHKIAGHYCHLVDDYSRIYELAEVEHLWSNRIAVVSNWYLVKQGEYKVILNLAEKFLHHKHDLMQKAVGWMLREMGKRELSELYAFLDKYSDVMPRTMLRYSIEKLSEDKRFYYMSQNPNYRRKSKVK